MNITIMIITSVYLVVMAVIDRRHKEIPVIPGVVCLFFLALAQVVAGNDWLNWLPGILVGIALYIVSKLSRGSVGEGDALVYMVTGISMGFFRNFELLALSLFLAAIVGFVLLLTRRVGRKYSMPFVPFTAIAYGVVLML